MVRKRRILGDAEGKRPRDEMASFPQQRAHTGSRGSERERIREAMLDLCFELGYRHIALPMLLERAGLEEADFHGHYADLEQCFYEIYTEELGKFRRRAAQAREGLTSWRDRVRVTAYALYRFVAEDERLRKLSTVEVRSAGERVQLLFGEEIEALLDLIDEGRREPGAPDSLTRATAEQVGGGIFNQLYAAGARPGPMAPEDQIIPQQMYAVVLPYLGVEAAAEELSIPPPPNPAAERERLREALLDLCFERGYAELTIDELCRRSGMDRTAFERRYVDLEECFIDFYEPEMQSFRRRMMRAGEGNASWRDRLRATAYDLLRFLGEDARLTSFVMVESRSAGERAQLVFAEGIEPLFDLVDEGRREMDDPDSLSRSTAEQIAGGIFNEIYSAAARHESFAAGPQVIPQMMYVAVLPYLGHEVAVEELSIPPPPEFAD
jgi:AcrR family transcriptional regulator